MQFVYRGIPYEASIAGAEAPTTEQTGTFLGKTYKMKQSQIAQRHTEAELTYRGIRYSR